MEKQFQELIEIKQEILAALDDRPHPKLVPAFKRLDNYVLSLINNQKVEEDAKRDI